MNLHIDLSSAMQGILGYYEKMATVDYRNYGVKLYPELAFRPRYTDQHYTTLFHGTTLLRNSLPVQSVKRRIQALALIQQEFRLGIMLSPFENRHDTDSVSS